MTDIAAITKREALDETGREVLAADLMAVWQKRNRAVDGTLAVPADYLEVVAVRA